MSRIADVLAELSNLGAVGGPAKPKAEAAPPPAPARARAPALAPEKEPAPAAEDVDAAIAALTEGFREGLDEAPEEEPEDEATEPPEEEDEEPPPSRQGVVDAPSVAERLDMALQEVEAIADVVDGLKNTLLALRAELVDDDA